jgi:lysophospholipase L1-like esterase
VRQEGTKVVAPRKGGLAEWLAGRVTWSGARDLVLIGLIVGAVVLAVQAIRVGADDARAGTQSTAPAVAAGPPSALFIGDDYTAAGAGIKNTCSRLTAKAMGWVYLVDAQAGTGFVADGQQRSSAYGPYFSRLDRDKAVFRPDYVVVTGGRNDADESASRVVAAATDYLRAVRRAFPGSRLVIVAPFWVDSGPPSTLLALRDAERALAPSLHAAFVDPLGGAWITNGTQSRYIAGDRVDPTVEGHVYLARQLTARLKAVSWPAAR